MPIQTDLSLSPYFDDDDSTKDYYKILFRPGVAVQVRELNQLQTNLQKQIERFGDNIIKRGSIVDGCNITFNDNYPYVKIKDSANDGSKIEVKDFYNYFIRNQANVTPLVAAIQTIVNGYESRAPDLKTLYVKYQNSGRANVGGNQVEISTFTDNETLTIYNPDNIVEKVSIVNAANGFSNTDTVVFLPAITIQNSTGGNAYANGVAFTTAINIGDQITDNLNANAIVVGVDSTSNSQAIVLKLKPVANDLSAAAANATLWTFYANTDLQITTHGLTINCTSVIGAGAAATLTTTAAGSAKAVTMTTKGNGYYVAPHVAICSSSATTGQINAISFEAKTYLAEVTTPASEATGSGYALSVGAGVVYQKGYFTRVNEHLVIASKYSNTGFDVVAGFDTSEEIVNSSTDTSLLDNATGSPNYTAPGADRLRLTPTLVIKSKEEAEANNDFLPIVQFNNGVPYRQSHSTSYNIIGDEMARRRYEESGNYVIDQFLLNTKSANTLAAEANSFNIIVDPGMGYIKGYRVQTTATYEAPVNKGTDTIVASAATVSMNFGNYVRVKEYSGTFPANKAGQVVLYDAPTSYITSGNAFGSAISPAGNIIGYARVRGLTYESGTPGAASCVYRLYLFDIRMNSGKNFSSVRAIYSDDTQDGIADIILETNGSAALKDNNLSSLLYYAGRPAVKSGNNFSYIYRTHKNTGITLQTNGTITFSATGSETFPYTNSATLSASQENDLIITPLTAVRAAANLSGSMVASNSTSLVGTSTQFTSQLEAGDYILINGTTVAQIAGITNSTAATLTTAITASGNGVVYFPSNVPISLQRSGRSANVDQYANTLVVNLGSSVNTSTSVAVTYNVKSSNTTPVVKQVRRNRYVRLQLSNNAANTEGPWVLGVPDIFRLKGVYLGPNATFTDTDTANVTNVTSSFYIDHNQTEDYYGLSYLYMRPTQKQTLSNTNFLLVKFDHFDHSGHGLKAPGAGGTYTIDDTTALDVSNNSINTLEIPEVYGTKGTYFDLRDQFDLRPYSERTATPNTAPASAPINPTEPSDSARFSTADKRFPAPDSNLTGVMEYYQSRIDRVVVDSKGEFVVVSGTPGTGKTPAEPTDTLTINILNIPAYPTIPARMSAQTAAFADTGIANERYSYGRLQNYTITTTINSGNRKFTQPKPYTMAQIGSLERRINDLEYYVSFTLAEQQTQSRLLVSPSYGIDRFKFGYFVDSFDTYKFSDVNNPAYQASVVNGFLQPKAIETNITANTPDPPVLCFNEEAFVSQMGATSGPVIVTQPANNGTVVGSATSTANIVYSNTTINQVSTQVRQTQMNRSSSDSGNVWEEFRYVFSNTSGPVELYLNSRDNNMAAEIFQGRTENGPWTSTFDSSGAEAITDADIAAKGLYGLNGGRPIEHPGVLNRKSYGPVGHFIEDQFKMLWTHDISYGTFYKIRIYKGYNHGGQGAWGSFEYKLFYPTDTLVNQAANTGLAPTTSYEIVYDGITYTIDPAVIGTINSSYAIYVPPVVEPNVISSTTTSLIMEQSFNINVTGLKSTTDHKFYFAGEDKSSKCQPVGGLMGDTLRTDVDGKLAFTFYYTTETIPSSSIEAAAAAAEFATSVKTYKVESADGLSRATGTIQVTNYVE